jgi:starvation-inducible DNA-binding protein
MSAPARILQAYGTWHKNPIGLPLDTAKEIGERLDALCASEYVLFHQVKKHHWMVVGAEYLPIHKFLDEVADLARNAGDRLAERVTALGGVPTGSPKGQQEQAVFAYEETEDAVDVRTMLGRDLSAVQAMVAQMRRDIELAREKGDYGTEELLQGVLLEHEDAAHHLDHWLEPDSLVVGMPKPK